jgi:hypothetical protein
MVRAPLQLAGLWLPLLLGVMAFAHPSMGQTITGRVVGVSDGDSLTLLVSGNRQVKVPLEGIDAPENGQEFSRNAKEGLSLLVFGKEIGLDATGTDNARARLPADVGKRPRIFGSKVHLSPLRRRPVGMLTCSGVKVAQIGSDSASRATPILALAST